MTECLFWCVPEFSPRGPSRKKSCTLSAETEIRKSTVKSRNPFWNPEIQSEIQKSTLKSGNPIQDSIKIVHKYPYTFINYTIRVHVHRFYGVIECHHNEWPLYPADLRSGTKIILLRWCNCNCKMCACIYMIWCKQTHIWYEYVRQPTHSKLWICISI